MKVGLESSVKISPTNIAADVIPLRFVLYNDVYYVATRIMKKIVKQFSLKAVNPSVYSLFYYLSFRLSFMTTFNYAVDVP